MTNQGMRYQQRVRCPRCGNFIDRGEERLPSLAYSIEHDNYFSVNCHLSCQLFDNQEKPSAWRWLGWILGYKSSAGWKSFHPNISILKRYWMIKVGKEKIQVRCYRKEGGEAQRLVIDGNGFSYVWSVQAGWVRVSKEATLVLAREMLR